MGGKVMQGTALWNAEGPRPRRNRPGAGRGQGAPRVLRTAAAVLSAVLLVAGGAAPVSAQSYPDRPIRLIVPYPPGGTTDILGRLIGPKLAERLGQPVVVENRSGAGGNVGADFVAKARPDGYTILIANADMPIAPSLYKKLNYDPIKDLAPISLVAQVPLLMSVRLGLPVKDLKELVEYAKANPGKLSYASSGVGAMNHLTFELLKSMAKIDIIHAPYKGGGPALVALMGGEVDMNVQAFSSALPHVQAGKIRGLAMLGSQRSPLLSNVPTAKESGIDNYEFNLWFGLLAPAETPRDIVSRLNAEILRIVAMPDTVEKIQKAGVEPRSGGTREQFAGLIKAEIARWAKAVKEANIPPLE